MTPAQEAVAAAVKSEHAAVYLYGLVEAYAAPTRRSEIATYAADHRALQHQPRLIHPHVFLDMGAESEIICQYCSTLYRYRRELKAGHADPEACVWDDHTRLAAE